MKTLLRTSALTAALVLAAVASRAVITTPPGSGYGTCHTTCVNNTTFAKTTVLWQTSEAECCSSTLKPPCPAGTHELYSAYQPPGGYTSFCTID